MKDIQTERQPGAHHDDNTQQNHRTDNGTQDDNKEILTSEDIMNL